MPEDEKNRRKSSTGSTTMHCVRRISVTESFEVRYQEPIPEVPKGGARVRVCYAGACYTDEQVKKSGQRTLKNPGVHDTSLFPGYEVSGVIDELCNTVASRSDNEFAQGDRVIVFPDNQEITNCGYEEYIIVKDVINLIKLPDALCLEVASLLPCGALTAYSAVLRAKPFVEDKIKSSTDNDMVNILIVGAGGLGLWTLQMAKYYISMGNTNKVNLTVADTCIEKLMVAKNYGCFDVIHWNDSIHEEYILERTRDVCPGGVDVCIDFVSSPRTINRATKILKEEGVMIVGGNSKYQVSICLNSLATKNQSMLGVNRGSRKQLHELVNVFSEGKISPPCYSVFPVDEANKVFEQLDQCKIYGRAVLRVSESDEGTGNDVHSTMACRSMSTDSKRSETITEEEDNVF